MALRPGDLVGDLGDLVVDLLEAAVRSEGKGQLNIGKLLRACAASLARSAAAERGFPREPRLLADDLRTVSTGRRPKRNGPPSMSCDTCAMPIPCWRIASR